MACLSPGSWEGAPSQLGAGFMGLWLFLLKPLVRARNPIPGHVPWFSHVTLSRPQIPFQVVDSELQRKGPPSFEFRMPFLIKILHESARCSAGSGWLGAHRLSLPPSKASLVIPRSSCRALNVASVREKGTPGFQGKERRGERTWQVFLRWSPRPVAGGGGRVGRKQDRKEGTEGSKSLRAVPHPSSLVPAD